MLHSETADGTTTRPLVKQIQILAFQVNTTSCLSLSKDQAILAVFLIRLSHMGKSDDVVSICYLFHPSATAEAHPGHSDKSAGGRLQLNMHAPYVCGFA